MRSVFRTGFVGFLLTLGPAPVPAQTGAIAGDWRGASTCVNRQHFPRCTDEQVVYEARVMPATPDTVVVRGYRIVDGRRDFMGEYSVTHREDGSWVSEVRTARYHLRLELRPAGDRMTGALTDLGVGYRVRDIALERTGGGYDPVTMDPPARDSVHPARLAEVAFESAGARLNGIFYLPAGPGPHPVVVLLHGNPGNERNLDVAQALRRAGYAALYFNYRGSWGSGGTFSRTHALEDVHAALRFVRSPLAAGRYRTDSMRVALVGHSMGGWLALLAAAADPRAGCVGALDFVNTGARGRRLLLDRAADSARTVEDSWLTAPGGPYRTEGGGPALVAEMKANAERWDLLAHAPALRERRVLLIGSANRTEHDSLAAALGGPRAPGLTTHWMPTDHSFSDRRIALARAILDWLQGPCAL